METDFVPTDPETTSWITAIVGALGLGGSGGLVRMIHKQTQKQVEFDQRHRATEARLARHSDAIKVLAESSARTETSMENLSGDIDEIKDGIKVLVNNAAGRDVV
tara:strand:+ start:138 stop:452 length:315 start_codon:yes stop_codon:yes gene_type:complete